MRRLASVLVPSRRTDRPDDPKRSSSRVFPSLSRKHLSPDPPALVASDLSSSSSSASTLIRTPDDDSLSRSPSKKLSWKLHSWLPRNPLAPDHPDLRPPIPGFTGPEHPLYSPPQMAAARANMRSMVTNCLVPQPSSSPLLHSPDTLSFPRSCHNSRSLRRPDSLLVEIHKKSLLTRLDQLSLSEHSSIAHLASRELPLDPPSPPIFHDDVFPSADSLRFHSSGLENWVSRPCFEDRFQLWSRSDSGQVICTQIPGSHLGVAALEFSESIELLAGTLPESSEDIQGVDPAADFTLPPLAFHFDSSASQVKELELEPLSLQSKHLSTDSPTALLQSTAVSLALPVAQSPMQLSSELTTPGSAYTNDPIPKRGVRFADDDGKDDQIPLGYVLRIRKNKEQKARFLREERERRQRAAQLSSENRVPPEENRVPRVVVPRRPPLRPLISLNEPSNPKPPQNTIVSHAVREEERLRREVEKIEMEKLKRSRELAKKQAEERERAYVEELQATRARREASRAGRPLESVSLSLYRDRSASRDSMHPSLRRSSIPHKQTPELVFTPVSLHDGSPSSSLPATPGSQYSISRPPSVYSSHTASSEDVKGRDGRHIGRRTSVVSDSAKGVSPSLYPPYDPRVLYSSHTWSNIPPVPPIPAIPMVNGIPFYGVDMPLLPPTPPFMMHEFGVRSRSYTGLAGQHSSEGVHSSSRNSSPHSSGSHQRRSSDDGAQMAKNLGDPRSGSYTDVRGSRTSISMRSFASASQNSPQRSSWLPPEQSLMTKKSSSRPISGAYGVPVQAHRRSVAS